MKKWATRTGVCALSFFLGYGANSVWLSQRMVTLCDIDANPKKYAGRTVRLRVFMSNDLFIRSQHEPRRMLSACSPCKGEDAWPGATVDLEGQQISLITETRHILHGHEVEPSASFHITDAIVVGRFEPPDGITHCFSPKYRISQASIERVIEEHEFADNEQVRQWMSIQSQ